MLKLGPYELMNPVLLAPMAGVTDLPMREQAISLGTALATGEMLASAPNLLTSHKSLMRCKHSIAAGLHSVQLVGNDPEIMAIAAKRQIHEGAQLIDINMGCPAKKVFSKSAGSALLGDPILVSRILSKVVAASDVPVTLKIRTGLSASQINGVEIAKRAEGAGITAITVHGRTRAQRFSGDAEYCTIKRIVEAVKIPVIANGDIDSPEKARNVMTLTGAHGIMIGRAAHGRLWLPGAIGKFLTTGHWSIPDFETRRTIMIHHLTRIHTFYGEVMGVRIARKHVGWYLKFEIPDKAPEFRARFHQLECPWAQQEFVKNVMPTCHVTEGEFSRQQIVA